MSRRNNNVPAPRPAVERRLYDEDDSGDVEIIEHGDRDDEGEPAAAAAAASPLPCVDKTRVVGGVNDRTECVARGSSCIDHLPTKLISLNCNHLICGDCFDAMKKSEEQKRPHDRRPLCCPMCKTIFSRTTSVNHYAMGQVCDYRVSCKNDGCPAVYQLGHDFHNERRHELACPFKQMDCNLCRVTMRQKDIATHACPNKLTECKSCTEMVQQSKMQEHIAGGLNGASCAGMVVCPLGCMKQESVDQGIVTHPSHPSRIKPENQEIRLPHRLFIPRKQELVHVHFCPCRPVNCSYEGCGYLLVHHELEAHKHRKRHASLHLLCMEAKAARLNESMESRIQALEQHKDPQGRKNPFGSGYTQIFNDIFKVPTAFWKDGGLFEWPAASRRQGNGAIDQLPVDDVDGITHIEFNVLKIEDEDLAAGAPPSKTLQAVINMCGNAAAEVGVRPRERRFAISFKICRPVRPGDLNSLQGMCIDPDVYFERFTSTFTMSEIPSICRLDIFCGTTCARAIADPEIMLKERRKNVPHLHIYVELSELLLE